MQIRFCREACNYHGLPHLLLWFESNHLQRHSRGAPFLTDDLDDGLTPQLPDHSISTGRCFATLRRRLRAQRNGVSERGRRLAERETARRLGQLGVVLRARRMAVYLSVDGELDLSTAITDAQRRQTLTCAPVIEGDAMRFAPLAAGARLRANRFGIPEPTTGRYVDPRCLDVVLTPLVAFDDTGTRMGMGMGYYDRCFSFLGLRARWHKPKLIGIGYEFQRVSELGRRAWDIPLWAAVTEQAVYRFDAQRRER